jgi:hypothetical protein
MNSVIIREADFNDERSVQRLCQRNGLKGEQSGQTWNWMWSQNPFVVQNWTIGWVLESGGNVVGFIGNIPRAYSFKGKVWIAAVGHEFVVDKPYRTHTLKLISAFFQQKQADLFIFSSANSHSGAVYNLARAKPIPQKNYSKSLFWVVSPRSFLFSLLRKKRFGKLYSIMASWIISPLLSMEMLFRRRWNYALAGEMNIDRLSIAEMGDEFNELWDQLQRDWPDRLFSRRDREAIAWQFSNQSANTPESTLLTLRRKGRLAGYLILTREDSSQFELKRIMVTDLIVLDDDPEMILALMKEAFLYAKQKKVAMLQMIGFPSLIHEALQPLHPLTHSLPYDVFWYYAVNADLKDELQCESVWYASTFDGDSSL